jgi:hypothetical protein
MPTQAPVIATEIGLFCGNDTGEKGSRLLLALLWPPDYVLVTALDNYCGVSRVVSLRKNETQEDTRPRRPVEGSERQLNRIQRQA